MRRRVFVSYKRKLDTDATGDSEGLADTVERGLTEYEVFRDKKIPAGDEWQRAIDRGLHLAHAAVVLLTESALKSQYVRYELSVLSFRARNSVPTFRLLVALIGIEPPALEQPPLTAIAVDALQVYRKRKALNVDKGTNEYDDENELCEKLIANLRAELPPQQSNIERLLADIVAALKEYQWICDDVEKHLELTEIVPEEQRLLRLAEALLRLRLNDFYKLFDVLVERKDVPRDRLFAVLELIFQFWVSGLLANQLAHLTDPRRRGIPLLRSGDKWTAAQVVRRAEELPRYWKVIDARLPGRERDADDAVRQALKDILKILPQEEREALSALPARDVVAELEVPKGLRVWFVLVSSIEAADALLALEKPWIRPIVFTTAPPTPIDTRLTELPLEQAREALARKTYKNIVYRIENPNPTEEQDK